jgi:hypothetical protein
MSAIKSYFTGGSRNTMTDDSIYTLTTLEVYGHVGQIYPSMLENPLADGALVVLRLETRLFVEVHVHLRSAEMLAAAIADGARQVFSHVQLEVALEAE